MPDARSLEQLITATRFLPPHKLAVALHDAETRHKRLAPTIIDLGLVDERRFASWMAEVTGLPLLDPIPEAAVRQLQQRLPGALAREYEVIPVGLSSSVLTIATINPLESGCLEALRQTSGMEVRPVIALYGALLGLLTHYYPEDPFEPTTLSRAHAPEPARPFVNMSSDTLLLDPGRGEQAQADQSAPGLSTSVITPRPGLPHDRGGDSQLDRVEKGLASLTRTVESLNRRLDAMQAAQDRVVK